MGILVTQGHILERQGHSVHVQYEENYLNYFELILIICHTNQYHVNDFQTINSRSFWKG
jgi:hypothetical protein